jgi:trimeric autotransporter adhesin
MKKHRNTDPFMPGSSKPLVPPQLREGGWPGRHQVAPSDLRQLIRLHQFFTETTAINKHQKSMKRVIQFKQAHPVPKLFGRSGILTILLLACFSLLPKAQALSPTPDGGYPGGNTAEGHAALFSLTSGAYNTALGFLSLRSNTEGSFNTATGAGTLLLNTGEENTATGAGALLSNTEGAGNTADGAFALFFNTTGSYNSANGRHALFSNTTGSFNTANGEGALFSNTEGNNNTATGDEALFDNTTGIENSAFGGGTLSSNTTGNQNTAIGVQALNQNTYAVANTAIGFQALYVNNGQANTAIGVNALHSNTTGNGNTALGAGAGIAVTTADRVIAIGINGGNVSDSCYIGNIFGATVEPGSALTVLIDSHGKLGTIASSKRFKEEIQPMDKASEGLLSLKPVTFRYKEYKNSPRQFGLIAEEVAEVNPDLVARDKKGEIYTVRYDQINAMLLNEFLKEHKRVEAQQATITELKSTVAQQQKGMETLTAQLKEQAAQIQKVSAQIEMEKPAPKMVINP